VKQITNIFFILRNLLKNWLYRIAKLRTKMKKVIVFISKSTLYKKRKKKILFLARRAVI